MNKKMYLRRALSLLMTLILVFGILPISSFATEDESPYYAPMLADDAFYMDVEDIFTVTGKGISLKGKVASGSIKVGDGIRVATWNGADISEYDFSVEAISRSNVSIDEGIKGDTISILIGMPFGTDEDGVIIKKDLVRGAVVQKSDKYIPAVDQNIIGSLQLYTAEEGGRTMSISSGYNPQAYIGAIDVTCWIGDLGGKDQLYPGETQDGVVISKLYHSAVVYAGQKIPIRDGGKTIGMFTVWGDPNEPYYAPVLADDAFYMNVESVFTITGRGIVFSGRVLNGSIKVGDSIHAVTWNGANTSEYTFKVEGIEMFHKVLDEALKGDNVGILIGMPFGTDSDGVIIKKDLVTGTVLQKADEALPAVTRNIIGSLELYRNEDGGRKTPITPGYSPQAYIGTTDTTCWFNDLCGKDSLYPGETLDGVMISELYHSAVVYAGQQIPIREGGRTIGMFTVWGKPADPYYAPALADDAFYMDVEDVFTITGRGIVLSGIVKSGTLNKGDTLRLTVGEGTNTLHYTVTASGIEMFRKELDQAQVGDSIGILIGSPFGSDENGFIKRAIAHGAVLQKADQYIPAVKQNIIGSLKLYTAEEGGRTTPITPGFKPQAYIGTIDLTCWFDDLCGRESLNPGEVLNGVKMSGLYYGKVVYAGQEIPIRQGGRTIGVFVVWGNEATDYNHRVNNVAVTDRNCMDVLEDGSVSYVEKSKSDAEYAKLCLSDVDMELDNTLFDAVELKGESVSIELVGENRISTDGACGGICSEKDIEFIGEGSLCIESVRTNPVYTNEASIAIAVKQAAVTLQSDELAALGKVSEAVIADGGSLKCTSAETLSTAFHVKSGTLEVYCENGALTTAPEVDDENSAIYVGDDSENVEVWDGVTDISEYCYVAVSCAHKDFDLVPAKESTCKEQGNGAYKLCRDCGAIFDGSDEKLPLAEHIGEWHTVVEATIESEGSAEMVCTVCGNVIDTKVLPKLDTPTTVPGTPTTVPGTPTTVPGTPTTVPDTPTTVPGTPTTVPGTPTTVPGTPTTVPGEPTTVPEEPTTKPGEDKPQYKLGDMNHDGKINSADARIALRVSAKLEELTEDLLLSGDMDGNGKVNSADARKILRIAAKLDPEP